MIRTPKNILFELLKRQFTVIVAFVGGALSVVISVSFLFASKVVIGLIEFVGRFLATGKRPSFFNRDALSISLATSSGLIFVNSGPAASILQIPTRIQATLFMVNIVLLALVMRYAKIALYVPTSASDIVDKFGRQKFFQWFVKRLPNPADIIWIKTAFVLTILIIPVFVGILFPGLFGFYTVLLYGTVWWTGSSALCTLEHANSHRHVFRAQKCLSKQDRMIFGTLRLYTEFILIFMFARVPKWYEVQHVFVHHQEDNGENDTQSTLRYDRASFIDFSRCANRFALSGLFSLDVIVYLIKKNRIRPLGDLLSGMFIFYVSLGILSFWNWHFTVTILAFRYCSQIIAALGFFQEHGMVDIGEPQNIYRNSIHFVSAENSHASLGDDAHIEHHLHMGRHWTRYTNDINDKVAIYSSEGALGYLDGADGIRQYYRLIWRRDYAALARNFIVFGNEKISQDDLAILLRERTIPVNRSQRPLAFEHLDKALGRTVGYFLV